MTNEAIWADLISVISFYFKSKFKPVRAYPACQFGFLFLTDEQLTNVVESAFLKGVSTRSVQRMDRCLLLFFVCLFNRSQQLWGFLSQAKEGGRVHSVAATLREVGNKLKGGEHFFFNTKHEELWNLVRTSLAEVSTCLPAAVTALKPGGC